MRSPVRYFDAFARIGPCSAQRSASRWTLSHLCDELDHCSIDGALVASTMCTQHDALRENIRLTEALSPHPHLFPLWNVLPHWTGEFPDPEKLLRLLERNGVPAVTLSPRTNGWSVRSTTSEALLRELERARVLTVIDVERELNMNDDTIEFLATRYSNLPLLLRAVPWSQQRTVVPLLLRYPNLHVTFDQFQVHCGIEFLTERGCENQMLYSSNAPTMSAGAHRCYIDYADVDESVRRKVAGGNLTRLLHGLSPQRHQINAVEDELMRAARHGVPQPTPVLDAHAHILDEGLDGGGGHYTMFRGGPEGVSAMARRLGVTAMGVMSWNGTVGMDADEGNRCVQRALDRLRPPSWGLATFDVVRDSTDVVRQKMLTLFDDERFLGLKPYPTYGVPYDDPRYDGWWQFGNERKLYCGLHPVEWYAEREFTSICTRFPDLTVVAYHCGASFDVADTAIALAHKHRNFMIEITLTTVGCGVIEHLVAGAGVDRVLYGSDLPMRDPRPQLGWVVFSRLPPEQKRRVLGLNAFALISRIRGGYREGNLNPGSAVETPLSDARTTSLEW